MDILSRFPSYRLSKDSPRPPPSFFTPLHYVRFPGNDTWPAEQERSCTASALARLTNPASPRDRYPAFPYGWRPLRARCKRCWPRRETLWYPRKLSLSRDATPMGNVTVEPMPGGQCAPPAAKSSSLRATQSTQAAFLASRHERRGRYKGRLNSLSPFLALSFPLSPPRVLRHTIQKVTVLQRTATRFNQKHLSHPWRHCVLIKSLFVSFSFSLSPIVHLRYLPSPVTAPPPLSLCPDLQSLADCQLILLPPPAPRFE